MFSHRYFKSSDSDSDGGRASPASQPASRPLPSSPPPSPPGSPRSEPSHWESFAGGVTHGPEAYWDARIGMRPRFTAPPMGDMATIVDSVGLEPMVHLGRAAYQALPPEEQYRAQGVAVRELGTVTGSLATGAAVSRVVRAIPDRRVRTVAMAASLGMSAVALVQTPRRAVEGFRDTHPEVAAAATTTLGHIASLGSEHHRVAVADLTASLEALSGRGGRPSGGGDGDGPAA